MSRAGHPDLAALTGLRSGKRSYYRAYVRSDQRMQRAVRAMDSISRALVRTKQGPRPLLEEVARAAGEHLAAEWTVLALADGELVGAQPRFLVVDAEGVALPGRSALPPAVRRELVTIRSGGAGTDVTADGWVRVPMTLEGRRVGVLSGLHGLDLEPEPDDVSVLRILANQAAVSLHTSEQYQAGLALHRRAQQLYDEAATQAADLAARTAELRQVEQRLLVAHQRELIDTERHRIARELHDSVTQYVLSAGMAVELARGEADLLVGADSAVVERLEAAKAMTAEAVDQLRRAIYALQQPHRETVSSLPELLQDVARQHKPSLQAAVRVEGEPVPLSREAEHEIARVVGEALFNVAMHADATRTIVRLRYRPDLILVSVSDDGGGDPKTLSRLLRLGRSAASGGRHRGLVNMDARAAELGGSLAFRRSRLGGVRVEMRLPLPLPEPTYAGLITGLLPGTTEGREAP